uniref:Uncharacterized protein n=1 Tax=Sinocyclocheilus rhinocerous TaxID=307959 RepID=A0A673FM52_9TELE
LSDPKLLNSNDDLSTHLIRLCLVPQVKQIEKRDSVLTSKQQIDRLLRPGASYFNLNPFEVLQIDPDATDEELKKRFRQVDLHLSVSVCDSERV